MGLFSGLTDALFGKPPDAPDYKGAAEATAQGDLQNARYQTLANRPDMYTPTYSQTWQQGGGFDQAGYDAAMQAYQQAQQNETALRPTNYDANGNPVKTQFVEGNGQPSEIALRPTNYDASGGPIATQFAYDDTLAPWQQPQQPNRRWTPPAQTGLASGLEPPNREDFMGNPDQWTGTLSLSPEMQGIFDTELESQKRLAELGLTSAEQAQNIFSSPFTIGGQTPAYQGPEGSIPSYSNPAGGVPSYSSPEGNVPTYQGPTGAIPNYQGPTGAVPAYQGPEGNLPTYGENRQNVYDAMMARVNTDDARARENKNSNLLAAGIPVSSEAYGREMERSDRALTDARQQAEISAQQMAGLEYQSALAGRDMMNQEARNQFNADMASRGLMSEEALNQFSTGMQGRDLLNREALNRFNTGLEGRILQNQEALNQFDTGLRGRSMQNQEALNQFNTGLQGRTLANQEALTNYNTGLDSRRQAIQEALLQRQTPINEISAFRSGSQVAQPQFQPYGQQTFTGGPNYLGATQAGYQADLGGYNAGVGAANSILGGLFDIGAAAYTGKLA